MEQLSGIDASFLYFETKNAPTHIGSFAVYDQTTADGGAVTFKGILANVESRLHLARCFRQKLVHVPLDLDHPYWIEDPEFDLEFHVRHIALPRPGDWRQLCIQVARIHARPLDLTKPLWEMYVIEGLDNVDGVPEGGFAVLTKIHHAAIDGVSGAELATAIHDLTPRSEPAPPETQWRGESHPSLIELGLRTAVNNIKQPFRMARVLGRTAPSVTRVMSRTPSADVETSATVPRTRFNGPVSSHRVVEGRTFSLDDIRTIRKAVSGSTVNDVVLTVCGGALRKYLSRHGELPKDSLVAFAPISVRSPEDLGAAGNQISGMSVTLFSDVEDPIERLQKMHRGTQDSKATAAAVGARTMTDVGQFMPGMLAGLAARLYTRLQLANRVRPVFNCIVTNVPGPQIPLYFTGARMVALHGIGPIMDGMGLIHPVFSCDGKISIAFTACRQQMTDPGFYAECLQDSFDELHSAAIRATLADESALEVGIGDIQQGVRA
jgi:WS/DGAT/MGAT family acyltransferase